ncbi:MAG: hypothetical protein KDC35_01010 [Acidobacteria bacterium]|nr:hypothetical protein [Acidobacteriota bacterium]
MGWVSLIAVAWFGMGSTSLEVDTVSAKHDFWTTYETYLHEVDSMEASSDYERFEKLLQLRRELFGTKRADDLFGLNERLDTAAMQKLEVSRL